MLTANVELVNQAAQIQDGQLIWVPFLEPAAATPAPEATLQSGIEEQPAAAPTTAFPINLNTATLLELQELPGIGEVRSQSIIAYRAAHGPFQNIEDIQAVDGIGPGIFEKIKDLVTVDSQPPGSMPP
ncbi:MAG: ComEA family DNA-binding protein [Anaerolineales bacterium]